MDRNLFLIATGANLYYSAGSPADSQLEALRRLDARPGVAVQAMSRLYRSPAFPTGSGPDYVNGCAAVSADCTAEAFLSLLHEIEAQLGRVRGARWQSRAIDLDLIGCGGLIAPDAATQTYWRSLPLAEQSVKAPERLILPHPRMQDRAFVLKPLSDIAPGWRHPVTGQSVAAMLAALPRADLDAVQPVFP